MSNGAGTGGLGFAPENMIVALSYLRQGSNSLRKQLSSINIVQGNLLHRTIFISDVEAKL